MYVCVYNTNVCMGLHRPLVSVIVSMYVFMNDIVCIYVCMYVFMYVCMYVCAYAICSALHGWKGPKFTTVVCVCAKANVYIEWNGIISPYVHCSQ